MIIIIIRPKNISVLQQRRALLVGLVADQQPVGLRDARLLLLIIIIIIITIILIIIMILIIIIIFIIIIIYI